MEISYILMELLAQIDSEMDTFEVLNSLIVFNAVSDKDAIDGP